MCSFLLVAIAGVSVALALQGHECFAVQHEIRQLAGISPHSPCFALPSSSKPTGTRVVRWSTALDTNAAKILTQDRTANGKLMEIEQVIQQSFAPWNEGNGGARPPDFAAQIARISMPQACGIDGLNSICFDQADMTFTPGVLAITRVVTADRAGIQMGGVLSTQAGQVLDADIYFNPSNSPEAFATPEALVQDAKAYDLKSVLTNEAKSFLTLSSSANRSETMLPCSPLVRTSSASVPMSQQQP